MTEPTKIPASADLPFTGLCCPKCEYNLTGTTEPRCPECGEAFDPAELYPLPVKYSRAWWHGRPSWRVTLMGVLLAVYLPGTWVFWIDYPFNDYRWLWVKLTAVLPAMFAVAWGMQLTGLRNTVGDAWGFFILGAVTAVMISICVLIGRHSRRWLLAVCIVMFALQIINGFGSYALFRA